jgi:predicted nucleotide-binding protein
MTGEDEDADGKLNARPNVIHEIGLFQGRLGFNKAIVLLENDTEEFSNIKEFNSNDFRREILKKYLEIF